MNVYNCHVRTETSAKLLLRQQIRIIVNVLKHEPVIERVVNWIGLGSCVVSSSISLALFYLLFSCWLFFIPAVQKVTNKTRRIWSTLLLSSVLISLLNSSYLFLNLLFLSFSQSFKRQWGDNTNANANADRINVSRLKVSSFCCNSWVLDMNRETLALLSLNNFLAFETTGLIDFSLILGNQIQVYVNGLLAVYNLTYRAARTNFFIFSSFSV